jgi:pyridine nucleotide-disulfide oxidoreductase family protein
MSRSQHLVLIGGGHSHAIALKEWKKNPIANVKLTLITNVLQTPYSGMLPGYIAGFYRFEETHIDLRKLAQFSQAKLVLTTAIALDLIKNQVICADCPPIAFDMLSIDIGITPTLMNIAGSEYVIPAKPVPQLLEAWEKVLNRVGREPENPLSISIVGGGAGGVELALNMRSRLQSILSSHLITFHLFHRGQKLLEHHNPWVSQQLEKILREREIQLHLGETVQSIEADGLDVYKINCQSNLSINTNYIFGVTQASAPDWIKHSDLSTDTSGFILIKNTLQTLSQENIFATGDIATMPAHPRPKAGVFAVRQGKPLVENWRNFLLNQPLKPYIPQKTYLSLIGTGDKKAIASWGNWGCQSRYFWIWKDYIDRQFMDQFI